MLRKIPPTPRGKTSSVSSELSWFSTAACEVLWGIGAGSVWIGSRRKKAAFAVSFLWHLCVWCKWKRVCSCGKNPSKIERRDEFSLSDRRKKIYTKTPVCPAKSVYLVFNISWWRQDVVDHTMTTSPESRVNSLDRLIDSFASLTSKQS